MEKKIPHGSPRTKAQLKSAAHHLKPVVQIGKKAVTSSVIEEIDQALLAHELIKVQVAQDLKPNMAAIADEIASETSSMVVDSLGNIIILFRQKED